MKNTIQKIFILFALISMMSACKKDETQAVLKEGSVPVLSASGAAFALTEKDKDKDAMTLSWSAPDYGFQAAPTYKVQFAAKGTSFAKPQEVNVAGALKKAFKTSELNKILVKIGALPGQGSELEVRVLSVVTTALAPAISNVVGFGATPYLENLDYTSLWVPGSYQGWDPATANKISAPNEDDVYEGYINMKDATTVFKMTEKPNFNKAIYGDEAKANTGKIASPGEDMQAKAPGFYRVNADLNTLTWSITKTEWGVVGDAAGSWDNDQNMTYDVASGLWKVTLALTKGSIKFRANKAWVINLGDNDADAILDYGGADIKINTAGNYEIALKLATAGNYTYILTKK